MHPRSSALLRFYIPLAGLFGLFGLVVFERQWIRAQWWAYRLTHTEDMAARGYYLACLAAAGGSAAPAVRQLARDPRPDVRLLAVFALQRASGAGGLGELMRLLGDADSSVSDAAASAMAFTGTPEAVAALCRAVAGPATQAAAAAAAGLGRCNSNVAIESLCRAAREHASPLVRAQAVESLIGVLRDSAGTRLSTTRRDDSHCDPLLALIRATRDSQSFEGMLSLERQVAAASARVGATRPALEDTRRTVGALAVVGLRDLTGLVIEAGSPDDPKRDERLLAECRRLLSHEARPIP